MQTFDHQWRIGDKRIFSRFRENLREKCERRDNVHRFTQGYAPSASDQKNQKDQVSICAGHQLSRHNH
jgi:hypothetical protein